jgi:Ca2+/Na+ antiporter
MLPLTLFFVILNALLIAGRSLFTRLEADREVLIIGNVVLFLVSLASFYLGKKGLTNSNPHAFVRSIYTGMILKLFACAIAVFIYAATVDTGVNKPSLFILMGFYVVYTFIEVSLLTRMLRQKTNG